MSSEKASRVEWKVLTEVNRVLSNFDSFVFDSLAEESEKAFEDHEFFALLEDEQVEVANQAADNLALPRIEDFAAAVELCNEEYLAENPATDTSEEAQEAFLLGFVEGLTSIALQLDPAVRSAIEGNPRNLEEADIAVATLEELRETSGPIKLLDDAIALAKRRRNVIADFVQLNSALAIKSEAAIHSSVALIAIGSWLMRKSIPPKRPPLDSTIQRFRVSA